MRFPGSRSLRQTRRWLSSRFKRHALILGYHRVAEGADDPYRVCISPANLEAHLQTVCRIAQPVTLSALAEGLVAGNLPERAVAVTFDDGYADNLYLARPILEKYRIPATFFITTGTLSREFWWDALARSLMTAPVPSGALKLNLADGPFEWQARAGSRDVRKVLELLYRQMMSMTPDSRAGVLAQLRDWRKDGDKPTVRAMTEGELVELAAGERIEIGSHSVTHRVLGASSLPDQEREIRDSKAYLESLLSRPVDGFSYPNGSYSEESRQLVRNANYAFACSSDKDVVSPASDRYALPRFWPGDWDGRKFEKWLGQWL